MKSRGGSDNGYESAATWIIHATVCFTEVFRCHRRTCLM